MLQIKTNAYRKIMASVPENSGLKIKAIMTITWVSMIEIHATVRSGSLLSQIGV